MSFREVISDVANKLGLVTEEEGFSRQVYPASDANRRTGSNPHAEFEQMHPAVNKDEPAAFANPIEAGAKKRSEEQCGRAIPRALTDDLQPRASDGCRADANTWMGSNPHSAFEQMHPAVNKVEPRAFANACESGAKKSSEAQMGKPMPDTTFRCQ
jgi:hypothetical protein